VEQPVLIGYMRVSKADGSQTLDLQRDALLAASVEPGHLYEDQASGTALCRFCRATPPSTSLGIDRHGRATDERTPARGCRPTAAAA
jgi:hypothetical protein